MTKLKKQYGEVFIEGANRDIYLVCALLDQQADAYLATRTYLTSSDIQTSNGT